MQTGLLVFDFNRGFPKPGIYLAVGESGSGVTSLMLSAHREQLLRGNNGVHVDHAKTSSTEELASRSGGSLMLSRPVCAEETMQLAYEASDQSNVLITIDSLDNMQVRRNYSLVRNSLHEDSALSRLLVWTLPNIKKRLIESGSYMLLGSGLRNGKYGQQSVHYNFLDRIVDDYFGMYTQNRLNEFGSMAFRKIRIRSELFGGDYVTKLFPDGFRREYELLRACLKYGLVGKSGSWILGLDLLEKNLQNGDEALSYFSENYQVILRELQRCVYNVA